MYAKFTLVDGVPVPIVSGGSGPPAAPESVVVPENVIDVNPDVGEVDDPAAAAAARLDAAFGPEGGPSAAAPADAGAGAPEAIPGTEGAPAAGHDDGDEPMSMREARKLREENADYRRQWQPFERAFGELDEADQHRILGRAPNLGADLALITDAFADLAPSDRQIIANVVASIPHAPEQAADALLAIAEELRKDPNAPADPDPGYDDDPDEPKYLTEAQFETRLRSFMDQARLDAEERTHVEGIQRELTELGYDLESDDLVMQARCEAVLALARRLDGDITKAHETLSEGITQKSVDEFVAEKAADADRPLPPGAGAPASGERQLETLDDSQGAMNSRLDAVFGPPRRR